MTTYTSVFTVQEIANVNKRVSVWTCSTSYPYIYDSV